MPLPGTTRYLHRQESPSGPSTPATHILLGDSAIVTHFSDVTAPSPWEHQHRHPDAQPGVWAELGADRRRQGQGTSLAPSVQYVP